MGRAGFASVLAAGMVLSLSGFVYAADDQTAGPGQGGNAPPGKFFVGQRSTTPQPPSPPIMDGRPAGPYRQYPFPYLGQFMGGFGYLPPLGDYVHSQRYGYNPDSFSRGGYPRDRSSRVLIVVEPTDVPGATYYYNAFPYYYGDPGYFAGNAYGDQYVTIVSPTVPQAQQAPQDQQAEQPQAAQVRVPAELAKADLFDCMRKGGQKYAEVLPSSFGASGEVDDQRPAADAGQGARDHRMRGNGRALMAHRLCHPRDLPLDDLPGGIRCNIPGADAGAARRQDQVHAPFVAPFDEKPADIGFFIGDDLPADDLHPRRLEHPGYLRSAPISAFAA